MNRNHVLIGSMAVLWTAPCLRGADIEFVDVSAARGIGAFQPEEGMGTGAAAADYDDDGYIDLFVPQAEGVPDQLYHNLGNGSFEEVAADVGLASTATCRVALWIDYDADNRLDLFAANDDIDAPSSFTLFRQNENGQFGDVTVAAGVFKAPTVLNPTTHHWGGICAGDINNDGYLDIFTGQWKGPQHLFLNNGNGTFQDISSSSGVDAGNLCDNGSDYCWVHQPLMADFNGDGWLDIYVAVDFDANLLWINQQNLTFVNAASTAGAANSMNDMGMSLGDYDNDGDLDIYITNIYLEPPHPEAPAYNVLYRNDSMGPNLSFTDVSVDMAVDQGYWGWGATFFDADKDGFVDIAATNGWRSGEWLTDPSVFYLNPGLGGGPFLDVSDEVQFNDTFYGAALMAADFDRDGDLDLVQTCMEGGPLRLLDNQPVARGTQNNYLVIKPRMTGPNRQAIGAVVRVEANGQSMMRLISAGTSYLGQEPAEAFFGVGDAAVANSVTIEWPGGNVTVLNNIPTNQVLTVTDGPGSAIPAVTEWGLATMVLLLAVSGTIIFRRVRIPA